MKKDRMTSAPDRQPEDLAPFLSASKPLDRLTSEQGRRIKARALDTLTGKPLPGFRWRWSTALAAVGLVLFGGAVTAAAARYGLIPWARVERSQGPAEMQKTGGSAQAHARVRKPQPVEPAPAPMAPENQAPDPTPQPNEPSRPTPPSPPRAGGPAVKITPTLPSRPLAKADPPSVAKSAPSRPKAETPLVVKSTPVFPAPLMAKADPAIPPVASEPAAFRPASRPARDEIARPPVMPQPVVNEQAALGEAMRRLRQGHDAAGALALLDKLEISHPRSSLALERSNLQVEALLTLGRESEALVRLDGMALDGLPRSAERTLLRGELRARFRRWSEARDDFEHALSAGAGTPSWHERALWGRGVARLRAGDRVGGEADLKRYLTTYPKGQHAAEAERLLSAGR
jgi:hypothetical protein